MNKKGLSLLEILISLVVLALLMASLTNLFVTGKRYILHSRSRMAAGELGRLFLDPLQMAVRQDTWVNPNNPLATGIFYCDNEPAHAAFQHPDCPALASVNLNGIAYTARYNITRDNPTANLTKVQVDINWTESAP